ncbi:uncharacterized protein (TIGR04255 family) [Bradyrhizobium sp. USDA 4354]
MSWNPLHHAHSIEGASAAINFAEPLTEVLWRRVVREAESRASACGLTARSQLKTGLHLRFSPGAFGVAPPAPQLEPDAVRFYRNTTEEEADPQFVAETLTVAKAYLLYHTATYTRWAAFSSQLRSMLSEPLGIALQAVQVGSLRLEYRDVFRRPFDGEIAPAALDLLRAGSDLLAPHIYNRAEMFHSHTGFFEVSDVADQRLIQVNVDATDAADSDNQVRSVSIMTAVQDNFFAQSEVEQPRSALDLISNFESMHQRSTSLFKSIISDEVAQRVGISQ